MQKTLSLKPHVRKVNIKPEQHHTENILIVDDQPNSLRLLTNILSVHGYEVRSAISGQMALRSVQAVLPDLLLLDVNMPEMDGYEVCQNIKQNPHTSDIPVIFISAFGDIFDKVRAFKIGGIDYITKPFQVEEVVARIENQLHNIRLQKQLKLSEAREREKAQQLAQALQRIQDAQCQFHTEKMSSLGRLVAGVAHEINNPICFIEGNLHHASEYTHNLLQAMEIYQQALKNSTEVNQEEVESLDLEFIKSDFPKLLNSMKVGTERISQLVKSLRRFSRIDEAKIKPIDIHESIENTLIILQHRLKASGKTSDIKIIREYGDLPLVECYCGPLNQVFMNILSNAIDALEESMVKEEGQKSCQCGKHNYIPTILIKTRLTDKQWVEISIADNGLGFKGVVKELLFDPFFTTKPLGTGTGLGLSISHQIIVDQHDGKLSCFSTPEKGAKFVIELPISQTVQLASVNQQG